MEETILKDIQKIKDVGNRFPDAKLLQAELVSKYRNEISNIEKDLDKGFPALNGASGRTPNYIQNLTNLKAKLELLLVKIKEEKKQQKEQQVLPFNIITNNNNNNDLSNNNNNSNTVDVKFLFEDARNKIEDDISLGEEELQEILDKINELEELKNSDEKLRDKWNKSKGVMTWLFTKGPKVATTILPLITEVIKLNN